MLEIQLENTTVLLFEMFSWEEILGSYQNQKENCYTVINKITFIKACTFSEGFENFSLSIKLSLNLHLVLRLLEYS